MAIPESGELKLWDTLWNQELAGTKGENSLHSASVYAGFSTPDALSDFYGWSDVEIPSVVSLSAQSVVYNQAILRGCVTDTGNEDVTSGFYFGTSTTSTSNPKYTLPGTRGTGIYCCTKTGISGQTGYKSWAFACNSAGECIAPTCCTFTTPAPPFSPSNTSWYQSCTVSKITQNFISKSHSVRSYYINPYNGSTVQNWQGPTSTGNDATGPSQATTNASNKYCHTGNYQTFSLMDMQSFIYAPNWGSVVPVPAPSNCKSRSNFQGFSCSDNNCAIQINARCGFGGPSGPCSIWTAFNFPSVSDIRLKTNISYL